MLVDVYIKETKKVLCDYQLQKVSDSVCVSLVELSLSDYIKARRAHCSHHHRSPCIKCERMLQVAQLVLSEGYCSLPHAFNIVSPEVKYTAERARRKLLQMPLVSICVGDLSKGKAFTILLEHCHGVDYSKMSMVEWSVLVQPRTRMCLKKIV